ncbi:hypothetical protein Y032_0039g159 [Ancylostoma ceylanicum]|uniref:ShKT domain-containing protein n=1 Tax=Ancylostoma ceylanicum TaxID=53326 RepID=A0A016UIR3_9BILA|nr:hypothetical protein Y032_0039g159 [Ancylostoma ceylanicum]
MRTAVVIFIALVLVEAWNPFKRKTTPNPAMFCKDNDESYCKTQVPNGLCKKGDKADIKDRCAKSCNQCCFDMYPDECKQMEKQGFCSFALDRYTVDEVKVLCGVTCKLCDS